MGGWLGLIGALLGKNKEPQAPLQEPQVTGQPGLGGAGTVAAPQVGVRPGGTGGFGQMLGQCAGPNPPMWCPKATGGTGAGSNIAAATNPTTGSEGLTGTGSMG